jgi:hypothetical protein
MELRLHSQIYDEAYERKKEKKRKTDRRIEYQTALDLVWLSEVCDLLIP